MNNKTGPFLVVLLMVASFLAGSFWTKTRLLEGEKQAVAEATPSPEVLGEEKKEYPKTIGGFSVLDREVCLEDGRPSVYFFGHSGCPHCLWEEPIVKEVTSQFGETIDFHNNMDSQEDSEVFEQYGDVNPGYVPFLVLGCKYARVGSGEVQKEDGTVGGEEEEEENLTALICKLTEAEPEAVCSSVADLTEQIE